MVECFVVVWLFKCSSCWV